MNDANRTFEALHRKGDPLVLYNVWDAGSAMAVAEAGAVALATGSWSVAGALGRGDGETIDFGDLLSVVRRIRRVSSLPLSVDFEAGYADRIEGVGANAEALAAAGVVGVNLEDGRPGSEGIREASEQARRIEATAKAGLFVNARTDLFLNSEPDAHAGHLAEALERAVGYAEAGARCFFVPGLTDIDLVARICSEASLPVNVMVPPGQVADERFAAAGAARISYGPGPFIAAMDTVRAGAREALSS